MTVERIRELEQQLFEMTTELNQLRKATPGTPVPNYEFQTLEGSVSLRELFAGNERLLVIHNMGQGCRYCTLWADGFSPFLPHLESAMSVVLVSKDAPEIQRVFANSRGWRFRLASHGGGEYIKEQTVMAGETNMPGAAVYELSGDTIERKNTCVFGPGDLYCSMWNLLGLAGLGEAEWTPQFNYWSRPAELDDGGQNLID